MGPTSVPDLDIHVITAKRELDEANVFKKDGVTYYYLPYPHLPTYLYHPSHSFLVSP